MGQRNTMPEMPTVETLVQMIGATTADYDRVGPAPFNPIAWRLADFVEAPEARADLFTDRPPA